MAELMWQSHDLLVAFDHLASTARLYQMMKDRGLWLDYTPPVATAAVAFVIQAAIEDGYDVADMRARERRLVEVLGNPAGESVPHKTVGEPSVRSS